MHPLIRTFLSAVIVGGCGEPTAPAFPPTLDASAEDTVTASDPGGLPDARSAEDHGAPVDDGATADDVLDVGAPETAADVEDASSPVVLDCALFCQSVESACGAVAPFASTEACLTACEALPLGTLSDAQGNTVGCRYTQLLLAEAQPEQAVTHCAEAGVLSAVCGGLCTGYCAVTAAVCAELYPSAAGCADGCAEQWSVECSLAAHLDGACTVCTAPPPPADTCESAVAIGALPFTFAGDTTGAGDDLAYDGGPCGGEFGGSGGAGAPDHVLRYDAAEDGAITVTLQGASGYDPILYVLTDCGAPTTSCLEKQDAVGFGAKEVITRTVTAGDTLFIVVDAADGQASEVGPYTVTVTAGP